MKKHLLNDRGTKAIIDFYGTMAIEKKLYETLQGYMTGIFSLFLNVVIDVRLNGEITKADVIVFEKFFSQHHMPWAWLVTSGNTNSSLEKLGLNLIEKSPAMYFDLNKTFRNLTRLDFNIKEIHQNDNLLPWIELLEEGFPSPIEDDSFCKRNEILLRQGEVKLRHFVGFYREQPIVAGTLFLSNDAVMLHNIATKKTYRQQGFGSLFTLFLMTEAKRLGYRHCFLEASKEGFNLYKKLGFEVYGFNLFYGMT